MAARLSDIDQEFQVYEVSLDDAEEAVRDARRGARTVVDAMLDERAARLAACFLLARTAPESGEADRQFLTRSLMELDEWMVAGGHYE